MSGSASLLECLILSVDDEDGGTEEELINVVSEVEVEEVEVLSRPDEVPYDRDPEAGVAAAVSGVVTIVEGVAGVRGIDDVVTLVVVEDDEVVEVIVAVGVEEEEGDDVVAE